MKWGATGARSRHAGLTYQRSERVGFEGAKVRIRRQRVVAEEKYGVFTYIDILLGHLIHRQNSVPVGHGVDVVPLSMIVSSAGSCTSCCVGDEPSLRSGG